MMMCRSAGRLQVPYGIVPGLGSQLMSGVPMPGVLPADQYAQQVLQFRRTLISTH